MWKTKFLRSVEGLIRHKNKQTNDSFKNYCIYPFTDQSPLGAWLGFGNQPHYKAPGGLLVR